MIDLSADGKIILKLILRVVRVWSGLNWLRIESSGEL
jgi:hypothetical protein